MTKSTTTAKEKPVNFFGLPERYSAHERSQAVIIPVPYEATTTYGKGTKGGAKAILTASQEVELFDEELWLEPYKIGIQTAPEVTMSSASKTSKQPFKQLYEAVSPLVEFGKFPIIVGGERSITLGGVRACVERYQNLSVLQISAHCDLRESHEGNPYSQASISYQLYTCAS